jgi:hypothetical protein
MNYPLSKTIFCLSSVVQTRMRGQTGLSLNVGTRSQAAHTMSIIAPLRYATSARLLCFQYKYPGTPTSTIVAPQNASDGRWMIVLSVQATPTRT